MLFSKLQEALLESTNSAGLALGSGATFLGACVQKVSNRVLGILF